MQYCDAHTHLNSEKLFPLYQQYIDNFVDIGGNALVNVGADHTYNTRVLMIADNNTNTGCAVYSVLGLHPCEVQSWQEKNLEMELNEDFIIKEFTQLKSLILKNRKGVVAVGECGIDLHFINTEENLILQKLLFRLQLELARELSLPIVIHSRDAFNETFDILKDFTDLKIYFHCWGYGVEEIKILLETFPQLWIGFTGVVSYPSASAIRSSLHALPLERILLETDAPYLAPQQKRGETNEPAFVQYVYSFVAEQLKLSEQEISALVAKNFSTFYSLSL